MKEKREGPQDSRQHPKKEVKDSEKKERPKATTAVGHEIFSPQGDYVVHPREIFS